MRGRFTCGRGQGNGRAKRSRSGRLQYCQPDRIRRCQGPGIRRGALVPRNSAVSPKGLFARGGRVRERAEFRNRRRDARRCGGLAPSRCSRHRKLQCFASVSGAFALRGVTLFPKGRSANGSRDVPGDCRHRVFGRGALN